MTAIRERLRVRKQEAADFEERARAAEKAESELPALRDELARYVARQKFFADLGTGHLEVPQSSPYRNMGLVEWEPIRSKLNGIQLAEAVQPRIDEILAEIDGRERKIAELVSE
jgi:hypothetical protein